MNSLGANAKSGQSQVVNAMNTMTATLLSLFNTIAKNWSKVMNSIISNAKSAANGVKSAASSMVSSLKKVENQANATAKAITKMNSAKNSKAEGGLETAATGKMFTANGQRNITIGDNPGGRETVAFIPHNNPQPILDKIAQMFGTVRMGMRNSGSSVSVSRGGSEGCIVQVFIGGKQIKPELVQMLAANQSAMK
jgi:hypothetical protein